MSAHASFQPVSVPPRAQELHVLVLCWTELDGRRLADILKAGGVSSVSRLAEVADLTSGTATVDVVVVDARGRPSADGAIEEILRPLAGLPFVVVGDLMTRCVVDDALDAGARGFVASEHVEERLATSVLAVASGQLAIPHEARGALERPLLSPREKQVLSLVILGFTNVEIAGKLFVAETTVKSHLSSAYRKLGVRSRQEATTLILDPRAGFGLGILSISDKPASPTR